MQGSALCKFWSAAKTTVRLRKVSPSRAQLSRINNSGLMVSRGSTILRSIQVYDVVIKIELLANTLSITMIKIFIRVMTATRCDVERYFSLNEIFKILAITFKKSEIAFTLTNIRGE